MVKIVDGRVISEHILSGEVTDKEMSLLFQSGRLVAIGSAAAWVSFPISYGEIPTVVACPAGNQVNTYARVLDVETGRFQWVADAPGSANWIAFGVK
ncbi:MAG: hypothetical protein JRC66_06655 [Deltaproteobacteria bacterium]|mgnify:CR=1 FL=1|nr:hypothetical protein [Deltaproteobacteria bacterium]